MQEIKIKVNKYPVHNTRQPLDRYDIDCYHNGNKYWSKSVYSSYHADNAVKLMQEIFSNLGITAEVLINTVH